MVNIKNWKRCENYGVKYSLLSSHIPRGLVDVVYIRKKIRMAKVRKLRKRYIKVTKKSIVREKELRFNLVACLSPIVRRHSRPVQ